MTKHDQSILCRKELYQAPGCLVVGQLEFEGKQGKPLFVSCRCISQKPRQALVTEDDGEVYYHNLVAGPGCWHVCCGAACPALPLEENFRGRRGTLASLTRASSAVRLAARSCAHVPLFHPRIQRPASCCYSKLGWGSMVGAAVFPPSALFPFCSHFPVSPKVEARCSHSHRWRLHPVGAAHPGCGGLRRLAALPGGGRRRDGFRASGALWFPKREAKRRTKIHLRGPNPYFAHTQELALTRAKEDCA